MRNKNNQSGATMVEMLGVLCVITALGISTFKLAGNLFTSFRVYAVESEVRDIQKSIKDRYSFDGDYSELCDITADKLNQNKLVPSQMYTNGGIYNRLGGNVKVGCVDGGDYYTIEFDSLSNRACLNLAQINWFNRGTTDLVSMTINSTPYGIKSTNTQNKLPVTASMAAAVCVSENVKSSDNVKFNTIIWVFQ